MRLPTASTVADLLLQLASREPGTTPRTHLDLQKHLYYVQGWALARLGRPMFSGHLEAWVYGPVEPTIYTQLCQYGEQLLPVATDVLELDALDAAFVASVWEDYKHLTPRELVERTHQEAPWKDARAGLRDDQPSQRVISEAALKAYFTALLPEPLSVDELSEIIANGARGIRRPA